MKDNDGTITDETTGLMWQQATPKTKMTWEQSKIYCEKLNLGGYTDWRLPTIQELKTIVDYSRYNPAINLEYFPDTFSSFYWSSTTYAANTSYAWGVDFDDGYGYGHGGKSYSYYVRAVRGDRINNF